jgi:hypothetical protein
VGPQGRPFLNWGVRVKAKPARSRPRGSRKLAEAWPTSRPQSAESNHDPHCPSDSYGNSTGIQRAIHSFAASPPYAWNCKNKRVIKRSQSSEDKDLRRGVGRFRTEAAEPLGGASRLADCGSEICTGARSFDRSGTASCVTGGLNGTAYGDPEENGAMRFEMKVGSRAALRTKPG